MRTIVLYPPGEALMLRTGSAPSFTEVPAGAAPPKGADDGPQSTVVIAERGFVWRTQVFFDDLDAMGMLHNAAYFLLIERAGSAFFEAHGWKFETDPALNPDQHYVVREQSVRYLAPIVGPGEVTVEMWLSRLGRTSATFGFEIGSQDGQRIHARAERVHVKLDSATLRPAPWSDRLREQLETIARSTP